MSTWSATTRVFAGFFLLACAAAPVFGADPVDIAVTGVEGDAEKNVQAALTLPYGLVEDGKVDRLWLDRFAEQASEKARLALEPYGYYHARVSTKVAEQVDGTFRLQVDVTLGQPVRVTDVSVELKGAGAGESQLVRLVAKFPLRNGDLLLQPAYERAKGELKARAIALGYLDAAFTRHEIVIAPGDTAASVALTLDTGKRYSFNGVRIEGAPDYPQPYLKRFVAFEKGEVFSQKKLGETQLNFSNSERFKKVIVSPEKDKAKDLQVPVLVQLTSAPRHTFRTGIGYGTDTGPRVSEHYRDLNLFHLGHDLDLSLYFAQNLQGFAALYTRPSLRDLKSSTTAQLNIQREDLDSYQSRLAALELARNRSFGTGELGTAYLKLQQESFTIDTESSSSRLVLPGYRFSKEQIDDMVRPRRGYRYALDLRGTHEFLGSDVALLQFIAEGTVVHPLPWRLSIHARSRFGTTLLPAPLDDLPPSIRFFAGGDHSVRGYTYQSLGPRNEQGKVVGGKHLLVGSLELERALYKKWGVSVFHDAGNAFNDFNNLELAYGAGVGVHYYTLIGGVNLYLAKPYGAGRDGYRIHFTVGFEL